LTGYSSENIPSLHGPIQDIEISAKQPCTGTLAGSPGQPSGLRAIDHIFVGKKGDFTEIDGQAPRFDGPSRGALEGDEF
jgi:hypothetical protein